MPEAPDLEVIKDYLNLNVKGTAIRSARVLRPTVLRPMAGDFAADLPGQKPATVPAGRQVPDLPTVGRPVDGRQSHAYRRSPVLRAQRPGSTSERPFTLELDGGMELRYLDDRQMGMVYYVDSAQLEGIYRLEKQGVDVLADRSFDDFKAGLKKFRGEVKGVLTRGSLVSGHRERLLR